VFGERQLPAATSAAAPDAAEPYELARRRALDAFERSYLTRLLDRTGGNVMAASRDASVNRAYLYRMLRRHGLR